MVPRCVATHRPLLVRGSLSPSQEHQPYLRSPQPASPKVPTCSRTLPRLAEKWGTFCANKEAFRGKHPTFSPNRATYSGIARLFCGMTRLLLRFLVSLSLPSSTRQAPSPIVHPQRPLLYVYLPSIRCPRRPLRHESRYRRRTPRRMGSINRSRRTPTDRRQQIARCAR